MLTQVRWREGVRREKQPASAPCKDPACSNNNLHWWHHDTWSGEKALHAVCYYTRERLPPVLTAEQPIPGNRTWANLNCLPTSVFKYLYRSSWMQAVSFLLVMIITVRSSCSFNRSRNSPGCHLPVISRFFYCQRGTSISYIHLIQREYLMTASNSRYRDLQ